VNELKEAQVQGQFLLGDVAMQARSVKARRWR
jgi:hypothetical protein